MNERERLIELLKNAKKYATSKMLYSNIDEVIDVSYDSLKADYLLENGVVVLPCKVGDTMFYAHRIFEEVLEAKLVSIEINSKKDSKVCATIEYISPYTEKQILKANLDVLLNVRLFLTKEEAERALKGGNENGK